MYLLLEGHCSSQGWCSLLRTGAPSSKNPIGLQYLTAKHCQALVLERDLPKGLKKTFQFLRSRSPVIANKIDFTHNSESSISKIKATYKLSDPNCITDLRSKPFFSGELREDSGGL